jgi:asparagine synthase (glutamine-hydrolysing)
VGDPIEYFDQLLTQAVKDRLHGTGVGIYMSGGIDSPMLAAKANSLLTASGSAERLQAFTVVFDHLIPDQERYYSGLVTEALGIRQHIHTADEFEFFAGVAGRDWRSPEPMNLPRWEWHVRSLNRIAAICPVLLTGIDGQSALLCSLPEHWKSLLRSGRLGRFLRDWAWYAATKRRLPGAGRFRSSLRRLWKAEPAGSLPAPLPAWLNPEFSKRTGLSDRWAAFNVPKPAPTTPRGRAFQSLAGPHFGTISNDFDAGWTGCPLEVRHPLMDVRLISFLLGLPAIPWCIDKELFRRWLRPWVPVEVHRRPKAPLLESPIRNKLQKLAVPLEKTFAFHEDSCYYVNPRAIGSLCDDLIADRYHEWIRPFSLNYWLTRRVERQPHHERKRPAPDQRIQAGSHEML